MKNIVFTCIVFACLANVSAQVKVNSLGQVGVGTTNPQYKLDVVGDLRAGNIYIGSTSNFFGTTGDVPVIFKVNNVLAGFTGYSGQSNVSFGYGALSNNSLTGYNNVAVGFNALKSNTTGYYNTANGSYALYSNTTGYSNTTNGYYALSYNTTGSNNTANGYEALRYNMTGIGNTANGSDALRVNMSGSNNTANGWSALSSNTTGNYNTAIGYYTLVSNTTGHANTAIGSYAGVYDDLSNATAIGSSTIATASNQVRIGNSSVTSIGGYAAWSNLSDGRAKKNIRSEVPGIAFINLLQPVMYNLDLDVVDELLQSDDSKINGFRDSVRRALSPEEKEIRTKARADKEKRVYTGFIAQDVEKAARSIGYDFSGVDAPENGKGAYGLRYAEFVVPLVKAVQELGEQNDAKDAAIASLQKQVNELTGLVYKLLGKESDPGVLRSGTGEESVTGLPELLADGASLQQNIPNPFNQSTVIRYTLPQTCNSAQIVMTNTAGRIVRQIPVSGSGEAGSITIEAGSLSAGIYYYSLYADNRLIDTKKMLLTEK